MPFSRSSDKIGKDSVCSNMRQKYLTDSKRAMEKMILRINTLLMSITLWPTSRCFVADLLFGLILFVFSIYPLLVDYVNCHKVCQRVSLTCQFVQTDEVLPVRLFLPCIISPLLLNAFSVSTILMVMCETYTFQGLVQVVVLFALAVVCTFELPILREERPLHVRVPVYRKGFGCVSCGAELSVGEDDLLTREVPSLKNSSYKGPKRRSNSV
ncbi:hypothetical protein Tco_0939733 [Tanacetum coccineum]|uniref:Transmembrane protein n=1 Tax=Tanacetum coccineum TaxID=301880 RepID=A0ABQ5DNG9_9ASTR